MSASISDEPYIIGPKGSIPLPCPRGVLQFDIVESDLRPWGERRESILLYICQEAFNAAKHEGIAVEVSRENAMTCFLLDYLDKCRYLSANTIRW